MSRVFHGFVEESFRVRLANSAVRLETGESNFSGSSCVEAGLDGEEPIVVDVVVEERRCRRI